MEVVTYQVRTTLGPIERCFYPLLSFSLSLSCARAWKVESLKINLHNIILHGVISLSFFLYPYFYISLFLAFHRDADYLSTLSRARMIFLFVELNCIFYSYTHLARIESSAMTTSATTSHYRLSRFQQPIVLRLTDLLNTTSPPPPPIIIRHFRQTPSS